MSYKDKCGFRDKIHVCTFKEEDCCTEKCDMYNLEWDAKFLKKKIKEEKRWMKDYESVLGELKKEDKQKYKQTKAQIQDIFTGIVYMSKAIAYIKRIKPSKTKIKLAKKMLEKIEKDVIDKT